MSEFGRFIVYWQPDYVFVENVPGLQKLKSRDGPFAGFVALLTEHEYEVVAKVLPASWFGVPQTRERLVLLASKRPGIALPSATHGCDGKPYSTVSEWIKGLPHLEAGEVDPQDRCHRAASLSTLNMQRVVATPEGGGRQDWPRRLVLKCHRDHAGHSDVYGRLSWDSLAAGLTTRCISYSNGRFGHPDQNRAISLREAACLQTFPRTFKFAGSLSSMAKQVGNAVPPLMATRVGDAITQHLKRQL